MRRVDPFGLRPEHERFRAEIDEALVDELYAKGATSLVALGAVAVFLSFILADALRELAPARAVLGAFTVTLAVRGVALVLGRQKRGPFRSNRVRYGVFAAGAGLVGGCLGALNVLSVDHLDAVHFGLLIVCQSTITSVALTSVGSSPGVYLLSTLPNLLPLVAMLALGHGRTDGKILTPMMVFYLGALCTLMVQQFVSRRDHLVLRLRLAEMAVHDSLTSLRNRRYLREFMDAEAERVTRAVRRRKQGPACASLLIVDVDHFKRINDLHGHDAGDAVLQQTAAVLGDAVRKGDLVVRWGGEEFVIVARDMSAEGSVALAERVRQQMQAHPFRLPSGEPLALTCSIGLSIFPLSTAVPIPLLWDDILALADVGLYRAKKAGRNRVFAVLEGELPWARGRDHVEEIKSDPLAAAERGLITLVEPASPALS